MKSSYIEQKLAQIRSQYADQPEYLQVVEELTQFSQLHPSFETAFEQDNIYQRLMTPDRIISFKVEWVDDHNRVNINRGWRVQHSNLIGPYKGGIRFHPSVNESVLKFLALEQTFKNALTGLSIGGAKGGADFDPKGKSRAEVMRFCQAFMDELHRHIGPTTDIPAGDINVGSREIGFLFGRYRRLQNQFTGALTGKEIDFGGSHVRTEATGFGCIFFIEEVLATHDKTLDGQIIAISGAGNVALHAAQKASAEGARVVTLSNSQGFLYYKNGLSREMIDSLLNHAQSLSQFAEKIGGQWHEGKNPWRVACDIAIPCATQNELDLTDAKQLIGNRVGYVFEGANMPCTNQAIDAFRQAGVVFAPAKAVNSGGVATSTFEMGQNAIFSPKPFTEIERDLRKIMHEIHHHCSDGNNHDYLIGANSFALNRLVRAMLAQGV
ncbi:NADP-specific glutamate dehydrogenase [Thalassotalea ponticola]|uniref:NADP-specific glutamate dehydrogenase n=1 Tax=Thalassotalea ponticola TaxID=1523392 RepID=UPI0025B41F02|nr:NADP-specific glutamate dehydrogenase [Thalassotalea ponticola]MDN3653548.1 NADP-specific glutamate dehydrogenase [Thalassotalea ponticola]